MLLGLPSVGEKMLEVLAQRLAETGEHGAPVCWLKVQQKPGTPSPHLWIPEMCMDSAFLHVQDSDACEDAIIRQKRLSVPCLFSL